MAVFALVTTSSFAQEIRSIGEVQGTGLSSPFDNQEVIVKDAVITVKGDGEMMVQSASGFEDGNPLTSDAIFVIGDIDLPIGTSLEIRGTINEYFGRTFLEDAIVESIDPTNKPFPMRTDLDVFFQGSNQYEKIDIEPVEWMLVTFENGKVTDPSENDGELWIYLTDRRPQREPGIEGGTTSGIPSFDANYESLEIININDNDIAAGSTISGEGYMVESYGRYRLEMTSYEVEKKNPVRNVVIADRDDFTIASCNLLFFNSTLGDFPFRLEKTVDYIIAGLSLPDIVAVQEVGNILTLDRLALKINEAQNEKVYSAFLEQGNNGSSINCGYLVSDRITINDVSQVGDNQTLSLGGALHDRPPFLLEGSISTNPPIPIKVLNLHLRSLSGITGSNEDYVRTKRKEQAESVTDIIDNLWDENLFVLGDYNAYQFSDGYVDVFRQIAGGNSEGALLPINHPAEHLLNSVTKELPEEEKYSFVYRGNTQQLDHMIYSPLENLELNQVAFYRGNADAPDIWLNNEEQEGRVADHDGLVASFKVTYPWITTSPVVELDRPYVALSNPFTAGEIVRLFPNSNDIFTLRIYDFSGRLIETQQSGFIRSDETFDFSPSKIAYDGMFIFKIEGADFNWSKPIFYIGNQ